MLQAASKKMPLNHNGNNNFPQRFSQKSTRKKGPRLIDFNKTTNPLQTNNSSSLNNRQSSRPSNTFISNNFHGQPQQRNQQRPKVNPKFIQNGRIANNLLSMQREENRSRLNGNYRNRQRQREDDDDQKYGNNNNNLYSNTNNSSRISQEAQKLQLAQRNEMLSTLGRDESNCWKIRIKDYELLYKIPILKYVYDIMGLVRIESYYDRDKDTVESESIDVLIDLLPCAGGLFVNLLRHKLASSSPQQSHWLSTQNKHGYNKVNIPDEIKQVLTVARAKYANDCPQTPLPSQVPFIINGIWETDIKFTCAFNVYLHQKRQNETLPSCEYHLRVWSNGMIKPSEEDDDEKYSVNEESIYDHEEEEEESSDDEDGEDPYAAYQEKKTVKDKQFYTDIEDDLRDVDIDQLYKQNKTDLKIKVVKRQRVRKKDGNDDEKKEAEEPSIIQWGDDYTVPEFDADYEEIKDLVQRVLDTVAAPSKNDAIMLLIDTRHDPDITVYVWRKPIVQYEEKDNDNNTAINDNLGIGDKHIDYRKEKYFDMKYNGRKVNVGQWIGLSTCIVDKYIHQFFSIFNTEIRFVPEQALELWPGFYYTQTQFEDKAPFEIEEDHKVWKKYKAYLPKSITDKLRKKRTRFTFNEMIDIEHKYEDEDWVGIDSDDSSDDEDYDDKPDIKTLKEYLYHLLKSKAVMNVRQKVILDRLLESDLTPKEVYFVRDHMYAKSQDDIKLKDYDKMKAVPDDYNGNDYNPNNPNKTRKIRANVSSSNGDTIDID